MLKTAPIFTDHLVLQREKPICIWGSGTPQSSITASLGNVHSTCCCSADGSWELLLPCLPAGGPYTLEITDGTQKCTLHDVMIGEVWLCGGQSNMELPLQETDDPNSALETCATSDVRLYPVGKRGYLDAQFYQEEKSSCWQTAERDICRNWTAVGYFFAQKLARKLHVTVGLISCNYGGTSASAWISEAYLQQTAAGQLYLKEYADAMEGMTEEEANDAYDAYLEYHARWQKQVAGCYAENPTIAWQDVLERCGENRYPGPAAPHNPLRPHGLYDTMITRITPYTMRGVLYYQGESDDHHPEQYAALLQTLIAQWRNDFRDPELPFLLVQLPMFGYEDTYQNTNWCLIREAQEQVYRTIRNTGLAVIPDCGEFGNIHPKEKQEPARRLYLQALVQVYGIQELSAYAPMYRDCLPGNGGLQLFFEHADDGLISERTDGFEVCDADGNWYPAQAEITKNRIFVSAKEVPYPTAARYLWRNYTDVTVFGQNGLPLAPFRTSRAFG